MLILLVTAIGLFYLFQILVQKKQILRPALVQKFGEAKARTIGILLSVMLIAVGVIGFVVSLSWSK